MNIGNRPKAAMGKPTTGPRRRARNGHTLALSRT